MFHLQKLLIVVILMVGALSFAEGRNCNVCSGNYEFCALITIPRTLTDNCFDQPERVRQDDDGCFQYNHNGRVVRGCLSRLPSDLYKECKESSWCKKCYGDNCNNEQYFLNRTTAAPITHENDETSANSSTELQAAPMARLSFGLISSFILVAIAAF